ASRLIPATWSRASVRPRCGTTRCPAIAKRSTGKGCTRWRWTRTKRAVTKRKAKLRAPTCAACAALCVRSTWTTRRSNSPKNARWQRRKRMPESNGVNVASALEIALRDDRGEIRKLADFRGRNVVLYFYPMDDTPGCTVEGKEFRELHDQFLALDTV